MPEVTVATQQTSAADLASPKRSNGDSDSDSTSTELCDEPDRLSDVDSEDLTSASESYVMATDEEKNSRVQNPPLPEKKVQSSLPGGATEPDKVESSQNLKTTEENLSDMSIAKITDQIRRLSAEDDNNSMVPQTFSMLSKVSDDSSIKESSLVKDKSIPDTEVDCSSDNNSVKKAVGLDKFDYLSFSSNVTKEGEAREEHGSEAKVAEEVSAEVVTTDFKDEIKDAKVTRDTGDTSPAMAVEETPSTFSEYSSKLDTKYDEIVERPSLDTKSEKEDSFEASYSPKLDTKYDRITGKSNQGSTSENEDRCKASYSPTLDTKYDRIAGKSSQGSTSEKEDHSETSYSSKLDAKYDRITGKSVQDSTSENEDRFKTSFDFSSRVSLDKIYEPPKPSSPISGTSPTVPNTETSPYCKTYIGHLPICPATVDQKLSRATPLLGSNSIIALTSEISSKADLSPDKPYFGDKIQQPLTKVYSDLKKSPKTPESGKSFSSGETMGPDSKPSSLTASPRTPVRSDSRDFSINKSGCSSVSSDSKTLVFRSGDSDGTRDSLTRDSTKTGLKKPYEKSTSSTPMSTDSLRNKSESSPKLVVSSSSDSCSPSKLKSSERSFSSDLQSPISANSIKYTSNYNRRGQDDVSGSPMDLSAATSPFYPISNPNQKTPSPYSGSRPKSSLDSTETSPEQKSSSSKESNKFLGYQTKFDTLKSEVEDSDTVPRNSESIVRPEFTVKKEDSSSSLADRRNGDDVKFYQSGSAYYRKDKEPLDDNADDPSSEKDTVPSLPQEKLDKHYLNYNYRHRDKSKGLERSSSSLDSRRMADLKSSLSTDEFATSIVKKRSSDILEDIKHLEAKANDGSPDTSLLTKKSSYIWEDLKSLEARRQDTFSNSASNFSKRRLEIPDISVTAEGRKSYVVRPKINIDENSDSILKTVACSQNNGDSDDGRESKLGVWTKVKPRKRGNNGRRNSDRALKIIQENSAILQKILACQAKKRLPDLEEISKEITISPINEEISKIFSPILEKMGLNEHEINEELARINFKDFDNMTATSVSEFDAKINEELSKLSLIDDTEQMDHFEVDEVIAHEYSDTREALIDRKINEELSKLLANYEEHSPASIANMDKGSSSQNVSEIDVHDLSSISTNVFSYKSSNDSIETRSDLGSTQEPSIPVDKYSQYAEKVLPYTVSKYRDDDSSPKSDIDIYRELEKLDKISSAQILPDPTLEFPQKEVPSIPYVPNASPFKDVSPLRYSTITVPYDTSPVKSSYDPYKTFDFKPKLSPKNVPDNPFATVPYDKPVIDTTFEYINHKSEVSNTFDLPLKSPMMTKESLEFRVRYEGELVRDAGNDYMSIQTDRVTTSNKSPSYYSNGNTEPLTPTKYLTKEERLDTGSFLDYSTESSDLIRRKYEELSPKEYSHGKSAEYERHISTLPSIDADSDIGSYLPTKHRDYHPLSPSRQFAEQHFPSSLNHYAKLSPGLADETQRPASHPDFPGKVNVSNYSDLPDIAGSSSYSKSPLSLGNIGHSERDVEGDYDTVTSPKAQFSPFPVRNAPRKPKELTLKLGLYSPKGPDMGQLKRS